LYQPIKDILKSESDVSEPFYKKIMAGAISGMIGALIANPSDLLKVKLQAEQASMKSSGIVKMFKTIVKNDGYIGLYRGVGPTCQRAVVVTGFQLSSYDHSKELLIKSKYFEEGLLVHLISAMIAGFVCATASAPIDTIKSRYMNQPFINGKGVLYSNTFDCLKKTVISEGPMALFKGWVPQWVRLGPHSNFKLLTIAIITFAMLEQLRRLSHLKPV
jgi:hypothetical protein